MSIVFCPLFTSICFNLKSRKLMLPALHFFIPSVLQTWIYLRYYLSINSAILKIPQNFLFFIYILCKIPMTLNPNTW